MHGELIERLRRSDPFVNDPVSLKPRLRNPDGPEAADALEASQAEVARLKAELAAARENALEEAARVADNLSKSTFVAGDVSKGYVLACGDNARRIRNLKEPNQ